jgi:hypothetical protein
MKIATLSIAILTVAVSAHATQETFSTAGPLDCSAVSYCVTRPTISSC